MGKIEKQLKLTETKTKKIEKKVRKKRNLFKLFKMHLDDRTSDLESGANGGLQPSQPPQQLSGGIGDASSAAA
jgi:hypothetical protein